MADTTVSIHRCTKIRVAAHDRTNANAIRLDIEHDGATLSVQMFNLPAEVTAKLLRNFADEATSDYAEVKLDAA